MYLLDTKVISELRKKKPHGAVLEWINRVPDSALFLCALTLGEMQAGVEITKQQDQEKARQIEAWLDQVAATFNVLPMDGTMFREWARMMHKQSDTVYEDAMIAACAKVHGLTAVTRKVRGFRRFSVNVYNPFA
jgi:predicted nucleic acid-binding protein